MLPFEMVNAQQPCPNTRLFEWPSGAVSFNPAVTQTFGDTVKVTGYRPAGFPSTTPCPAFGNFQYNDGVIDNPFNNGVNAIGLNHVCFDLDNNRLMAYQVFEFNPELLGVGAEFLCFDIYDIDALLGPIDGETQDSVVIIGYSGGSTVDGMYTIPASPTFAQTGTNSFTGTSTASWNNTNPPTAGGILNVCFDGPLDSVRVELWSGPTADFVDIATTPSCSGGNPFGCPVDHAVYIGSFSWCPPCPSYETTTGGAVNSPGAWTSTSFPFGVTGYNVTFEVSDIDIKTTGSGPSRYTDEVRVEYVDDMATTYVYGTFDYLDNPVSVSIDGPVTEIIIWLRDKKDASPIAVSVTLSDMDYCNFNVVSCPPLNAGINGTLTICEGTTVTAPQLFAELTGSPDVGGSWSPALAGAGVYTYTVTAISPCTGTDDATVTVSEQTNADAGTNGTLDICTGQIVTAAELFAELGGTPDVTGSWTPALAGAGVYTYTVTAISPCTIDDAATVTVSEVTCAISGHIYEDLDGDGTQDIGEPDLAGIDVVITDADSGVQTVTTNGTGDWVANVIVGNTIEDIDESTLPESNMLHTEGNDPTITAAVLGATVVGGTDGFQRRDVELTPLFFIDASNFDQAQVREAVFSISNLGTTDTEDNLQIIINKPLASAFDLTIDPTATTVTVFGLTVGVDNASFNYTPIGNSILLTAKNGFSLLPNDSYEIGVTITSVGTPTSTGQTSGQLVDFTVSDQRLDNNFSQGSFSINIP